MDQAVFCNMLSTRTATCHGLISSFIVFAESANPEIIYGKVPWFSYSVQDFWQFFQKVRMAAFVHSV